MRPNIYRTKNTFHLVSTNYELDDRVSNPAMNQEGILSFHQFVNATFSEADSGRCLKMSNQHHLLPRPRMREAMNLLAPAQGQIHPCILSFYVRSVCIP
jgi:hypothetical protein